MSTRERYYRRLRDDGRGALSAWLIAGEAAVADSLGLWLVERGTEDDPVTIDGRRYRVTLERDPYGWGDSHAEVEGEVIDRYPHPDYIGGDSGHDRADDDEVIALDDARAYRTPDGASVGDLAGHYHRAGMARGPARDRARQTLRDEGDQLAAEFDDRYGGPLIAVVTVEDRWGDIEALGGVHLPDRSGAATIYSLAHLIEVVRDLAAELRDRDDRRAEAIRTRYHHLPMLCVVGVRDIAESAP